MSATRMSHAPRRQMVGDSYLDQGLTYSPTSWNELYIQNQHLGQMVKRDYERDKLVCCTLDQFTAWWMAARMIRQDGSSAHVFCRDGELRWCRLQLVDGKCIRGEGYLEQKQANIMAEEVLGNEE